MFFQGSVKILAGTFKTYQELIVAAITARAYVSAQAKLDDISRVKAQAVCEVFTNPQGDIYVMNAWKGVVNGVATQSAWAAGDFTAEPGGGEKLSQGKFNPANMGQRFELSSRIIYAVGDTVIYLDVTFP
jgi:hypothetical protein